MLNIQSVLVQLIRKIAVFILAGLVVLMSLPSNSVLAEGYYSAQNHSVERVPPYYTAKDRRIAITESSKPYYATKERPQKQATRNYEDSLKTGKREHEVRLRNLEPKNR
ncbi:hypothetical protein IQ244_21205 [Nostoc sp. LEGE 06077]|uniref:hypothetical protein n=1 Tax=Nostoc sp. LEGE 06077 TaxID=915325 RepID=UPI00187FEA86|nr:hypothetical protein [Nostoc sp. LEGE 06077]MBE9209011.1 hypothetical protein [Nostoc sp. LEGE 06077]